MERCVMGLEEGDRLRIIAIWYLVGLPSYQNLTEAMQLLLSRVLAEILTASRTQEPSEKEEAKPQITFAEWRPLEPEPVKKARLARRSGRYARYEQVIQLKEQGLRPKE